MATQTLLLSTTQRALFRQLHAAKARAARDVEIFLATMIAAHELPQITSYDLTDAGLVVTLPDPPPEAVADG